MLTKTSLIIRLHANDDVVIARQQLVSGTALLDENVTISGLDAARPQGGHARDTCRRAGQALQPDHRLRQAGDRTGRARASAQPRDGRVHARLRIRRRREADALRRSACDFPGIVRADGRVATRNYIGILSTVNCSATVAHGMADAFEARGLAAGSAKYANVDGVVALTHGSGCGMDANGESMQVLRRTLGGYARHANFAGVLIVGLGCEANQISALLGAEKLSEGPLLRTFSIQDTGGTAKAIARGVAMIEEMLPHADRARRETVPARHLTLGLQCGGSDGYSGISANPALGAAVDLLVRNGGTAILSETPEIYGAEHLLTRRAVSREVGEKLVERIRWWEDYTARNKRRDEQQSLARQQGGRADHDPGEVARRGGQGGTTNLVAVYSTPEPVTARGFVCMDTPGYDPVSATGQVAGGANMICFTTGRGSAYGCAPAPSLKLATNTALWNRQEEDIDINCGEIVDGTATVEQMGERFFQMMLVTASGTKTKSELHGYGQNEFVPWYLGAVM